MVNELLLRHAVIVCGVHHVAQVGIAAPLAFRVGFDLLADFKDKVLRDGC